MAKLAYSKLGLKFNSDTKTIKIGNYDIEVKQYLPIEEKLKFITNILNAAADGNNFSNPVKLQIFSALEIMYSYTNLTFTDKQKEDPGKLYDILNTNGVIDAVVEAIPQEEYNTIIDGVYECSDAVYSYRNSTLGILDTIQQDYSNLNLEATEIQKKLNDPSNITLVRDILTKMG